LLLLLLQPLLHPSVVVQARPRLCLQMQFSDEFLAKWEHIVDEVVKTEVPLECIKKVVIKFDGKRQKTVNLQLLRRQGLDLEEIEVVLSRTLTELGDSVRDVDFMVDIGEVAKLIQPVTDDLLKDL
jgi:hypothetical protein